MGIDRRDLGVPEPPELEEASLLPEFAGTIRNIYSRCMANSPPVSKRLWIALAPGAWAAHPTGFPCSAGPAQPRGRRSFSGTVCHERAGPPTSIWPANRPGIGRHFRRALALLDAWLLAPYRAEQRAAAALTQSGGRSSWWTRRPAGSGAT